MNISEITTLISTLGFPIVCVGAMGWYIAKRLDKMSDRMEHLEDAIQAFLKEE